MGALESLQRLADRKAREIAELERQVAEYQRQIDMARAYLQAIQDSVKALPKEIPLQVGAQGSIADLRAGSLLARARDAIQENGKPMHIVVLLAAIGVANTKSARVSLVGSLGGYVRKGLVFTRPAPNTFGLVDMKALNSTLEANFDLRDQQELLGLPDDFGQLKEGN